MTRPRAGEGSAAISPQRDATPQIGDYAFLGLAVVTVFGLPPLLIWLARTFVSPFWLAVAFGMYPLFLLINWVRLKAIIKGERWSKWTIANERAVLTEQNAELISELAVARAKIQSDAAITAQTITRANADADARRTELEAHGKTHRNLSQQHSRAVGEVARLAAENAALKALVAAQLQADEDRRSWRTLPQGYDLDSERFAAAVATALR